ncbi:MAG: MFS transporter [Chloroflexi bacterium]|nr:MFS transporter [Chloroflexota bacterium]
MKHPMRWPPGAHTPGWPAYLVLFSAYFAFGVLLQVFPPLLDAVSQEFGVSRQSAALVMTVFMAPLVLLCVPIGLLIDRHGVRRVGRAAFLLMLVGGGLTTLAGSFPGLLVGRVVSGIGGGLLVIVALTIVARAFPHERRGLALGIFAAGLPAGTGIAFNALAALGPGLGWRTAVLGATLVVAGAALLFEALARGAATTPGAGAVANPALALSSGELWRLAATTAFGYAAILAFTTWAPTTLVGYAAIPPWLAAFLASLLLVIDIPFAPLWGGVSDRVGRRKPFIVAAFAVYLAGSLIVPQVAGWPGLAVPGLLVVIAAMGIGCAMFFPTALAIPAEVVAPERAGAAYGLFFAAQIFGMALGPVVFALALDHGTASDAFRTVSVLTFGGLLAALTLRSR